jgi:Methyltransferase domain
VTPPEPRRPWSPIPTADDIDRATERWESPPRELPGIDLNVDGQLTLLQELGRLAAEVELPADPDPAWRFHHDNGFYDYGSAILLYGVMRHTSPRRIVEVGSGFSSALMLDVNERFLDGRTECTFVEPFSENRLLEVLRPGDEDRVTIVREFLQDVDLSLFDDLEAGDILFVDSSHVSKMGSDVHLLISEVMPHLPAGAWVHVHDVFYPFEYPPNWAANWIKDGRAWNEAYHLRAFLEHNDAFRIEFFSDYLRRFERQALERALPGAMESPTGTIWLQRVG